MPVTVVATPVGDATCNSYITVAEGDAFLEGELGTLSWATATTDRKNRALIAATKYLDQLLWIGSKVSATQALLWPRINAACGEKSYSTTVIPPEVKYGTFLLAEALLADPTVMSGNSPTIQGELITGIPNADLKRAKLDIMELEFREAAGGSSRVNALSVLPALRDLFGCLCASARPEVSQASVSCAADGLACSRSQTAAEWAPDATTPINAPSWLALACLKTSRLSSRC